MDLSKLDKFRVGFLPGILLPPLFMLVYVKLNQGVDIGFFEYLEAMIDEKVFSALIAVSAIINLLLFLFFMHKEYWQAGRGMLLATMLFGIFVVYFKM